MTVLIFYVVSPQKAAQSLCVPARPLESFQHTFLSVCVFLPGRLSAPGLPVWYSACDSAVWLRPSSVCLTWIRFLVKKKKISPLGDALLLSCPPGYCNDKSHTHTHSGRMQYARRKNISKCVWILAPPAHIKEIFWPSAMSKLSRKLDVSSTFLADVVIADGIYQQT